MKNEILMSTPFKTEPDIYYIDEGLEVDKPSSNFETEYPVNEQFNSNKPSVKIRLDNTKRRREEEVKKISSSK